MGSSVFVARLQIRRRWRSLVAVMLFVAVVGGIAIALVAGARRSSSVVRRYFGATIPYNVTVGVLSSLSRAKVSAVPGVLRADPDEYFASTLLRADGTLGAGINGVFMDRAAIDPTFRVLHGRLPDAADDRAILVNESFVRQLGLHAGDTLTVKTFAPRDRAAVYANHYDHPHGPVRIALRARDARYSPNHRGGGCQAEKPATSDSHLLPS